MVGVLCLWFGFHCIGYGVWVCLGWSELALYEKIRENTLKRRMMLDICLGSFCPAVYVLLVFPTPSQTESANALIATL